MSTQACVASVGGSAGNSYTKTNTDDAWGEMVDANSLSLWQTLKGETLTCGFGSYTGGAGVCRIRNQQTNQVKAMWVLQIVTEEQMIQFDRPVRVDQYDVLEVFSVAVPT